jgi:hypothetical protein
MISRTVLLIIAFVSVISCGCTRDEERRLRAYLPDKGKAYKYCTYTSKNQKKHWDDLEENEISVDETVATVLVTSEYSYPDERIIEHQAFTPYREEPFVSQRRLKLRKDKIIYDPESTIMLKSPIKLKNKWNVTGWKATPESGEETFKVKCEIISIKNDIILGKDVNTIEVSCYSKEKGFGKTKHTFATGLGIAQYIHENDEGIVVIKDELCWDQSMSHLNLQQVGTTLPRSGQPPASVEVQMPDGSWVPGGDYPAQTPNK